MTFLTIVGIALRCRARPLVALFTPGPEVVPVAVRCLQLVSLGYPFYAWGMIMEQAFNGAGDTRHTHVDQLRLLLDAADSARLVSERGIMGPRGVYLAICGAESVLAVVSDRSLPPRQMENHRSIN